MAGWHHPYQGHELGQTLGDGEGQGGLACCSPWSRKELDTTGCLNNSVVDLQYCVSFRCIAKGLTFMYVYICMCVYMLFYIFFSIIGYYKILSIVPCAIQ